MTPCPIPSPRHRPAVDPLVALLRLEWSIDDLDLPPRFLPAPPGPYCPVCKGARSGGHRPELRREPAPTGGVVLVRAPGCYLDDTLTDAGLVTPEQRAAVLARHALGWPCSR